MRFRHVAVFILLISMNGCVFTKQAAMPGIAYTNSYKSYDMQFNWKTTRGDASVTISGTMTNQSYYYIAEPELTAALLDRSGKIIAQGTFIFFPHQMALDETAPFTVKVPYNEKQAPYHIRFTYRYRLAEEGLSSPPRIHSFEGNP